ncbi:S66 family peptidase [Corynebacterium hadale]|uniref:S66 family peptidase n=1 Tax=Corynebacterium hadale TaxID=2026255 RepID=UPI000BAA7235|nr:S66 peptidase family protein [Corynebacterium hadale]PAT12522.1 LD-carboxypeptidase [Corynebacterium hadale]
MTTYPRPLQAGDTIRVVAPSRSLAYVEQGEAGRYVKQLANERLATLGISVTFGDNVRESDMFWSSSAESRAADLHDAFADPEVAGIMSVIGGFTSNEVLPHLDFDLIAANPKFLCGNSDISAIANAIYARTGVATYIGPHWSTLGMRDHSEVTRAGFEHAAFGLDPIEWQPGTWFTDDDWFINQDGRVREPDDGWWPIQAGTAHGVALGANLGTLGLLAGTEFMPSLERAILFAEVTGKYSVMDFRRELVSLLQMPDGEGIEGVVIGRFQTASRVTRAMLEETIASIPELEGKPVIANASFGHTNPLLTFPVGGEAQVRVLHDASIRFPRLET